MLRGEGSSPLGTLKLMKLFNFGTFRNLVHVKCFLLRIFRQKCRTIIQLKNFYLRGDTYRK